MQLGLSRRNTADVLGACRLHGAIRKKQPSGITFYVILQELAA
jgi:hypothetical protein